MIRETRPFPLGVIGGGSSLLSPFSFLLSRFISSSSSLSFPLFLSLHSALVFFSPLSRLRSPLSFLLFRISSLISFLSFPFPAPVSAFLSDLFSFPSPFSPLPFPFQSPFFPQASRTIYETSWFLAGVFWRCVAAVVTCFAGLVCAGFFAGGGVLAICAPYFCDINLRF